MHIISNCRPDILKHEIKAFFVKYNDPIYVKLEKLDIMIRLATQQNIGQVLAELKEYGAFLFNALNSTSDNLFASRQMVIAKY